MDETLCPRCGKRVPEHVDRCVVCGQDVGFPNVRAASRAEQTAALVKRYGQARQRSVARGVDELVAALEARLETSTAVICKSWGVINLLLLRDSRLLQTFYQDVEAEARLPEDNEFDRTR